MNLKMIEYTLLTEYFVKTLGRSTEKITQFLMNDTILIYLVIDCHLYRYQLYTILVGLFEFNILILMNLSSILISYSVLILVFYDFISHIRFSLIFYCLFCLSFLFFSFLWCRCYLCCISYYFGELDLLFLDFFIYNIVIFK